MIQPVDQAEIQSVQRLGEVNPPTAIPLNGTSIIHSLKTSRIAYEYLTVFILMLTLYHLLKHLFITCE